MKLTIDRSKWLRGDTERLFGADAESRLCDSDGRMCCLGFYLAALGARGLRGEQAFSPSDLGRLPRDAKWLVREKDSEYGSDLVEADLISVNDGIGLRPAAREARIARLFAKQGVKVRFVGRTPPPPNEGTAEDGGSR